MVNNGQKYPIKDDICTLNDVADYLKLSEKTVLRMVHGKKIPCAKVGGQWRFMRSVIDDWLLAKMKVIPRGDLSRLIAENAGVVPLSRLIHRDLITLEIKPGIKEEVLSQLVEPFVKNGIIPDGAEFFRRLVSREHMASTAIGKGVAIPHIRHPEENPAGGPLLGIGVCREGTDFDSFDGQKTYLFFLLYTDSELVHLNVMGKLAALLHDEKTVSRLITAQKEEDIIKIILHSEYSG
jgi:PTS system nitrogen regulatory IIA component